MSNRFKNLLIRFKISMTLFFKLWKVLSPPCGIPVGVRWAKFHRTSFDKIRKLIPLCGTQAVQLSSVPGGFTLCFTISSLVKMAKKLSA